MKQLILLFALLMGCTRVRPDGALTDSECSPAVRAGAAQFDSLQLDRMVGTFRMIKVRTSFRGKPNQIMRSKLVLTLADSARRAGVKPHPLSRQRRAHVVGREEWNPPAPPREPAEGLNNMLVLGCRDCADGSPDYLTIEAADSRGFSGTWVNYQTGIGRCYDDHDKPLSDPAGYFCAIREPSP